MEKHKIALSVENAGVRYRRRTKIPGDSHFWALKNVSFNLYRGETLGIIGRNGVGKSTLLRLLAGIIVPDEGVISRYVKSASLLSLQVGFLAHLTGKENAVLSGMLLGMRYREVEEKLNQIIEFSGLEDFINEPVGSYSSGMRARLGFAVAFHSEPEILLIDEVLGVGDSEFKQKSTLAMKDRILSDQTVVIVSHNLNTIRELCDHVVWLEHGSTKMDGDAESVIKAYNQSTNPDIRNAGKLSNMDPLKMDSHPMGQKG